MAIPLIVVAAATAFSAWNRIEAGKAEAGAFEKAGQAKRIQAESVMDRFDINSEFTRLEGRGFQSQQLSAFAKSGVDIGSGMALSALEDTASKIERRVEMDRMEAEANRDALLMGADLDMEQARQAESSGVKGAFATVASSFLRG